MNRRSFMFLGAAPVAAAAAAFVPKNDVVRRGLSWRVVKVGPDGPPAHPPLGLVFANLGDERFYLDHAYATGGWQPCVSVTGHDCECVSIGARREGVFDTTVRDGECLIIDDLNTVPVIDPFANRRHGVITPKKPTYSVDDASMYYSPNDPFPSTLPMDIP